MKTIFFILQGLTTLTLLGIGLYLAWRTRQFKKQQQRLVAQLRGQRFWRINIARPEFISGWMRLSPYEASGVLVDNGDSIKIQGFWQKSGKLVESTFPRSALGVEWLGNQSLRAGNLYWAKLKTDRGSLLISADTGMNALKSREGLEDIFRGAFPDYALNELEVNDFALEKNPRTRLALMVFFSLMAFALLDTFVISTYELTDHQLARTLLNPTTVVAVLLGYGAAVLAAYQYFIKGEVPARESWVLSGFLATMVLLSLGPLAKRLDQALAQNPSQDYAYRIVGGSALHPQDSSLQLPNLRFPRSREYWAQFEDGTPYQVPFLRGPLGLWQLDHQKFDKPLVLFYEKANK